jgi:hypothetical protein
VEREERGWEGAVVKDGGAAAALGGWRWRGSGYVKEGGGVTFTFRCPCIQHVSDELIVSVCDRFNIATEVYMYAKLVHLFHGNYGSSLICNPSDSSYQGIQLY